MSETGCGICQAGASADGSLPTVTFTGAASMIAVHNPDHSTNYQPYLKVNETLEIKLIPVAPLTEIPPELRPRNQIQVTGLYDESELCAPPTCPW